MHSSFLYIFLLDTTAILRIHTYLYMPTYIIIFIIMSWGLYIGRSKKSVRQFCSRKQTSKFCCFRRKKVSIKCPMKYSAVTCWGSKETTDSFRRPSPSLCRPNRNSTLPSCLLPLRTHLYPTTTTSTLFTWESQVFLPFSYFISFLP